MTQACGAAAPAWRACSQPVCQPQDFTSTTQVISVKFGGRVERWARTSPVNGSKREATRFSPVLLFCSHSAALVNNEADYLVKASK